MPRTFVNRGQASASARAGWTQRLRLALMARRVTAVMVLAAVTFGWWASRGPSTDPSNPFNFFDEVVVITVPLRKSRVVALLASLGLDDRAVVMPAVPKPRTERDWATLRESSMFVPSTLDLLTAGETAVSQSQRKALRTFLANGDADRGLIFEDDFFPNGESLQQVRARLEMAMPFLQPSLGMSPGEGLSQRWDILFLGRCHDHCEYDRHIGADVYQVFNPACLHAYAVTRSAARLIIDAAAVCEGAMCPIDNVVRSLIRGTSMLPDARRLTAFAVSPQLFTQESKFRGDLSMVKADKDDIARMKAEGNHLTHAQRGNRDELVECMLHHERVLVSHYDMWRDRTGRKPSPREREWQQNMMAADGPPDEPGVTR